MKDQTHFSKDWLEDPDFKIWLVSCTNNIHARCKLCQKTFNLSNMLIQALVSHTSGKKHKLHDSRVEMFFKPATVFFFNWDSLHARLNGYCRAWSYKKKKHKKIKIKAYRESV